MLTNLQQPSELISQCCQRYDNDPKRMIDILWAVQRALGWISRESMQSIASCTDIKAVQVEGVVTFYHFFKTTPQGKYVIHLCDDIIDRHQGMLSIEQSIKALLGIELGQTTEDGLFSLHRTPCIGLSDQAPAAMINDAVVTRLTPARIKTILNKLRKSTHVQQLFKADVTQPKHLADEMVKHNIRRRDQIFFSDYPAEAGWQKAQNMAPAEIIQHIAESKLRGRGGAGFPVARKWQTAASTPAPERYVICNADEGEPGTFKDRVLLSECAELLFEGMRIAGRAIGSRQGIVYLRAEYRYLLPHLEAVLQAQREQGLLNEQHFDIRIQLGAGAYVCGEESALIASCEGRRGEPANKPPFPAEVGYLCMPTVVNNVETLCAIPRIIDQGGRWFSAIGTAESSGTKLLSVCGDCKKPGVYEFPFGVTLREVLSAAGAQDCGAVQVGGASGILVGEADFDRAICFEDLPSAGAIMIFSKARNILEIVDYFMQFFIEESCGYCTPCRVGNVFLQKSLDKIRRGLGEKADLDYLKQLTQTIIQTSRCGFGHTSPNPILSSMQNFPLVYAALLKEHSDGMQAGFDLEHALAEAHEIAKRRSLIYPPPGSAHKTTR
jgi:[NiFe] hydrogenase diaphorase moiety large subunit